MDLFNTNYLFASLLWSSVGMGYWIYGKHQTSLSAMVGGAIMIAVSWLIMSALVMSLVCLGLIFGIYIAAKQGY